MPGFFLSVLRLIRFLMSGDGAIAIENAALRLQLAAFQRKRKRPVMTSFDRVFWVGLSLIWNRWRAALVYVQSDNGRPLAAGALSQVLGTPLQGEPTTAR